MEHDWQYDDEDTGNLWKAPGAVSLTPRYHGRKASFDDAPLAPISAPPGFHERQVSLDDPNVPKSTLAAQTFNSTTGAGLSPNSLPGTGCPRTPQHQAQLKREPADELEVPPPSKKPRVESNDSPSSNAPPSLEDDIAFVNTIAEQMQGFNPGKAHRLKCLMLFTRGKSAFSFEVHRILEAHLGNLESLVASASAYRNEVEQLGDATAEEKQWAKNSEDKVQRRYQELKERFSAMKYA